MSYLLAPHSTKQGIKNHRRESWLCRVDFLLPPTQTHQKTWAEDSTKSTTFDNWRSLMEKCRPLSISLRLSSHQFKIWFFPCKGRSNGNSFFPSTHPRRSTERNSYFRGVGLNEDRLRMIFLKICRLIYLTLLPSYCLDVSIFVTIELLAVWIWLHRDWGKKTLKEPARFPLRRL